MKKLLIVTLSLITFLINSPLTSAQVKPAEVVDVYDLADQEAKDGDIIVSNDKGLLRATAPWDMHLFGVVVETPLIAYRNVDQSGALIARTGVVSVRVSDEAGPINPGDFITSSTIAGVGQKSTKTGYVIGSAMTKLEGTTDQANVNGKTVNIGRVNVSLRIEFADLEDKRSLTLIPYEISAQVLKSIQDSQKFATIARYFIAIILIFTSLISAYLINNRAVAKSIEAIGRNPLAKPDINASLRRNTLFGIAVIIVAVVASAFIILIR